ncbi:hypothetical protein L0156_10040, partial [bacterium]|nr:hypothetical protein [bacterium]
MIRILISHYRILEKLSGGGRYMIGIRGKSQISRGSKHLGFRCVTTGQTHSAAQETKFPQEI